jgi:predicted lysophospholipase L1 biosynthesis ABC-type transport system permease subunit
MGKALLVLRLAVRDLRRRPGHAALLLVAIAAATTTLSLGLVLRGAAEQPYQSTRAVTAGPDVVLSLAPQPGSTVDPGDLSEHLTAPGVTASSGPFPYTQRVVTVGGVSVHTWLQGRDSDVAAVDRPALLTGEWTRPGGVVVEAGLAEAIGADVGDAVDIGGRPFTVTGTAVTAAAGPYPKTAFAPIFSGAARPPLPTGGIDRGPVHGAPPADGFQLVPSGLMWLTEADTRAVAEPSMLAYVLDLRLADPKAAPAFAAARSAVTEQTVLAAQTWQDFEVDDGWVLQKKQFSLMLGSSLLVLVAVASITVLVGARMADQVHRAGLLKAVGATPALVAVVLLAEHLAIALLASALGLAAGRLLDPVLSDPGAGLLGGAGQAPFTPGIVAVVVGVALSIAALATFVPAARAARISTIQALARTVRPPRRSSWLITLSARMPVPLLLGLRIAARRPRRTWLGVFAVATAITGIVASLAARASRMAESAPGLDPRLAMTQGLLVISVMLAVQATVNMICVAWATTLDTRRSAARCGGRGGSAGEVSGGVF